MKTILSIQSQVAGAPVGNGAAAFAMARLGVRVLQLPTTLYGRRPDRGAPGGRVSEAALLSDLLAALNADGQLARVDAVLSGYLAAEEQIAFVVEAVDAVKAANKAALYMCDPVMGDEPKGLFVSEGVAEGMVQTLAPLADWLAPNLWELGRIAGRPCADMAAARAAARRLGKPTLISSVPTPSGLGVLYCAPGGDWLAETPLLPSAPKGTGDLLTALFLARRIKGEAAPVALEAATGAVHDVIVQSLALGVDDLALETAQDLLVEPRTWPRAQALEV